MRQLLLIPQAFKPRGVYCKDTIVEPLSLNFGKLTVKLVGVRKFRNFTVVSVTHNNNNLRTTTEVPPLIGHL